MEGYGRRLPVYLLLDCSGSMSGEPIEAVRQGIATLISDLQGDPQALETAYLSVITFDSSAQQVVVVPDCVTDVCCVPLDDRRRNRGGSTTYKESRPREQEQDSKTSQDFLQATRHTQS